MTANGWLQIAIFSLAALLVGLALCAAALPAKCTKAAAST